MIWVYIAVSSLVCFFLVFPFLEVLCSFIAKERVGEPHNFKEFDFACIITAYKNVDITKPLVTSLLHQNHTNFHIYLVADHCDVKEYGFSDHALTILKPEPALNLKAKSIIYAVERFIRPHDYTVIFDADNLAHPDFLKVINQYAALGNQAIQGQRTAKNLDTLYACADSMGEFYKNYIDRYVPYLLGSSAVISGSGMAIQTSLYKDYLYGPEIQKGKHQWKKMLQEDKILQNDLLMKGHRIVYAWDALVYDEKVTSADAVETQRSRWLFSYFQNTKNAIRILGRGVRGFNFNQFWFGLVTIAPPMFIQLALAGFLFVLGWWLSPLMSMTLALCVLIFSLNIPLVLYLSKVPNEIWRAFRVLPFFVWRQFRALFKMRDPNKHFKHSEHNRQVSVDDVLKDK